MASSSSTPRLTLRIVEIGTGSIQRIPLRNPLDRSWELEPEWSHSVLEDGRYAFAVEAAPGETHADEVEVYVNGEPMGTWPVVDSETSLDRSADGKSIEAFRLAFGFVCLTVILSGASGIETYETSDVPVLARCDADEERRRLRTLYEAILEGERDEAFDWMLGEAKTVVPFRISGDEVAQDEASDLRSFLQLTKRTLAGFRKLLPAIRRHPAQRPEKARRRFDPAKVDRLGSKVVLWIAMHPETLDSVDVPTGITDGRSFYMARSIEVADADRSVDTYENRTILSFLEFCLLTLRRLEKELESRYPDIASPKAGQLAMPSTYVDTSLLVLDALGSVRSASANTVKGLIRCAKNLLSEYEWILPHVATPPFKGLRQIDAFREFPAYVSIYRLMERWLEMGIVDIAMPRIALATPRIDQLVEHHALHQLLMGLRARGFIPRGQSGTAISMVSYGSSDGIQRTPQVVANRYLLSRADEQVQLYVRPVIHGSSIEEHGVTLHRTTVDGSDDPSFTPSFLIRHAVGSDRWRDFVIEARYVRTVDATEIPMETQLHGHRALMPQMDASLARYMLECRASDTLEAPAAVWLLCGRDDENSIIFHEKSEWSSRNPIPGALSGIVSLLPRENRLERLFLALGIGLGSSMYSSTRQSNTSRIVFAKQLLVYPVDIPKDEMTKPMSDQEERKQKRNSRIRRGGFIRRLVAKTEMKARTSDVEVRTSSSDELNEDVSQFIEESGRYDHSQLEGSTNAVESMGGNPSAAGGRMPSPSNSGMPHHVSYEELVRLVYETSDEPDELFKTFWAQTTIKLNMPLFRKILGTNRERKLYRPIDLDGKRFYFYSALRPDQVSLLKRHLQRLVG